MDVALGFPGPVDAETHAERLRLLNATLRYCRRAGSDLTAVQCVGIARSLVEVGADVIEVGTPASSPQECQAVRAIAQEVRDATIFGLARCDSRDIELTAEALGSAPSACIRVVLTAGFGREYTEKGHNQLIAEVVGGVSIAGGLCEDVDLCPEYTSELCVDLLIDVLDAAIEAGAKTISSLDERGRWVPDEVSELLRCMHRNLHAAQRVRLAVRRRNDPGLALANSQRRTAMRSASLKSTPW